MFPNFFIFFFPSAWCLKSFIFLVMSPGIQRCYLISAGKIKVMLMVTSVAFSKNIFLESFQVPPG